MTRVRVPLAILALAAGCEAPVEAPWLTYPGVDGHAPYLVLSGTPHDPSTAGTAVSCEGCHPSTTFLAFECTGCHAASQTDPIHASIAGYAAGAVASADCYRCHPQGLGVLAPAEHVRFFPIATASHPAVCTNCHTDLMNRGDLAKLACSSCHQGRPTFAGRHAGVSDFPAAAASVDCLRCHADGQVDRVADHQPKLPIAAGSSTHGTVCLHCHTGLRADKTWAADFSAYDCTACHANPATDGAHVGVAGYLYASASCYGCHPQGTGIAPADHPSFFPVDAASKHAGVGCRQCHSDLANPRVATNFLCGDCHLVLDPSLATRHTTSTTNTRVTVKDYAATSDACLRCHADSQVDWTSSHPSGRQGDPPHEGATCTTCHDTYRTDKPYGADFAVDPRSWPAGSGHGCVSCHKTGVP